MVSNAALIGPGRVGSDLMVKIAQHSAALKLTAVAGRAPSSEGLALARELGAATTADGVDGLIALPEFADVDIIFDATDADAHRQIAAKLAPLGTPVVNLTPASDGPQVVPAVNLDAAQGAADVSLTTCCAQVTVPIVAAVAGVGPVHYAEIVSSAASATAGPRTRAGIEAATSGTARALEQIGGAARGKAIIVLNPAEPPLDVRATVQLVVDSLDDDARAAVAAAVDKAAADVRHYASGYRLKQDVQFTPAGDEISILLPEERRAGAYTRITVFLEVVGSGAKLPTWAGNLDILTGAALATGEYLAAQRKEAGK